jgi:hypothetical protein
MPRIDQTGPRCIGHDQLAELLELTPVVPADLVHAVGHRVLRHRVHVHALGVEGGDGALQELEQEGEQPRREDEAARASPLPPAPEGECSHDQALERVDEADGHIPAMHAQERSVRVESKSQKNNSVLKCVSRDVTTSSRTHAWRSSRMP